MVAGSWQEVVGQITCQSLCFNYLLSHCFKGLFRFWRPPFFSSAQGVMWNKPRVVLNRWSFWVYVSGIKSRLLQITGSSLMSFNFLKYCLSGIMCDNLNLAVWTQGTQTPGHRVCCDWTQRQTGRGTETECRFLMIFYFMLSSALVFTSCVVMF